MAFIVESGAGTPGANAYCNEQFVTDYLTDRGRQTEGTWNSAGTTAQRAAIVAATDYIETRWGPMFRGVRRLAKIAGREASGRLVLPSLPLVNETLTVGLKVYRYVDTLSQEDDVLRGATVAETIVNTIAAMDGDTTAFDVTVEAHTQPNYEATGVVDGDDLVVAARVKGEAGNAIAFSTTITGATITAGGFLTDGIDEAPQPLSFPRTGIYTREGIHVVGVPLKVRFATAEYAVRARVAMLAPDPTIDATLLAVVSKSVAAGPVSKSVTYESGFRLNERNAIKPYPAADRLLGEYVVQGGGTYR